MGRRAEQRLHKAGGRAVDPRRHHLGRGRGQGHAPGKGFPVADMAFIPATEAEPGPRRRRSRSDGFAIPPFSGNPDLLSSRPVPRLWFLGTAGVNPLKNLMGSEGRPVQAFSPARTKWKKTLGAYSHL